MICGSYFRKCAPCEDEEGKDVSFVVDRKGFSSRCAASPPACLLPVLLLADARARPELVSNPAYDQNKTPPVRVVSYFGGAGAFKDEHPSEAPVSPSNAGSISSSGTSSMLNGFLLALMMRVKWSSYR